MKAMILTGGKGSRLYPLTRVTPKALLDIKGKPMLAHILDSLDGSKYLQETLVVYPHEFDSQFKAFERYYPYTGQIRFISDKDRDIGEMPGSIGAIAYVVKNRKINDDLLVVAGDNLFDLKIDSFLNFHQNRKMTSIAVYDCGDKKKASRFGVVELDERGRVTGFEEKPHHPKTTLVSTLCYALSNHDLHHLQRSTFKENAGDLIRHLVENNNEIYGFKFTGKWFDIGTPEDLERARKEF